MLSRIPALAAIVLMCLSSVAAAQEDTDNSALIGELMAFHGSEAIVDAMTTHCYETTGLDEAYKTAAENWYLRNISYLDLADRVIEMLGGADPADLKTAREYGGSQIMSAYNQARDKDSFCRSFLDQVETGAFDIDNQLPGPLKRAQEISAS